MKHSLGPPRTVSVHTSFRTSRVRKTAGTTWLARADHPDEVPLAGENGLRTCAFDCQADLFLACGFDDGFVEVDVDKMKRGEAFRLPSESYCTADLHGGFWVFVPPAGLYYLSPSGQHTKVTDVDMEIVGPVQLRCWQEAPPILTVEAPCRLWGKMGSDVFHTLCFYRVQRPVWRRRSLRKLGKWSVHAGEGRLETWVYIPRLKRFLVKLDDRFCLGSAADLVSGRGLFFTVSGIDEICYRATVIPDSSKVFFVGARGNLYLLDVARRGLEAVHFGTAAVTQIVCNSSGSSIHAVLDRIGLAMFYLEEGNC